MKLLDIRDTLLVNHEVIFIDLSVHIFDMANLLRGYYCYGDILYNYKADTQSLEPVNDVVFINIIDSVRCSMGAACN